MSEKSDAMEGRDLNAKYLASDPVLLRTFDSMATAATGPKRLRELVLTLAVQGKLVTQKDEDEPADVALKHVVKQKIDLTASGKLKREQLLRQITINELPFDIPANWAWVRLGQAALKITDGTHHSPPNGVQGKFMYISAKNIRTWGIDLSTVTYVAAATHDEIYSRCDPEIGDVLYVKDGATTGVLTINTLSEPFSMLSSVALLKPSVGLSAKYLAQVMAAPFFYNAIRADMSGVAITRVTLSKLGDALIPLPPLAEQHRIVARVEELMKLCDVLEKNGRLADEQHARLASTLFDALAASESAHALAENWQQIAEHFDILLDRSESIDKIEKIILQLAVRGLLVMQEPNDGSARQLLADIASEKHRLAQAGQIRSDKVMPEIGENERAFKIPDLWIWVRFGHAREVLNNPVRFLHRDAWRRGEPWTA